MTEAERETLCKAAWRIEMYHRGFETAMSDRTRPMPTAAPGDESHRTLYQSICAIGKSLLSRKIELDEAKTSIIRDAVRAYLSNPRYLLLPTA